MWRGLGDVIKQCWTISLRESQPKRMTVPSQGGNMLVLSPFVLSWCLLNISSWEQDFELSFQDWKWNYLPLGDGLVSWNHKGNLLYPSHRRGEFKINIYPTSFSDKNVGQNFKFVWKEIHADLLPFNWVLYLRCAMRDFLSEDGLWKWCWVD